MNRTLIRTAITAWLLLVLRVMVIGQDARILLKFEDAEKAYVNGSFQDALQLIDEVETSTGVTSRTLYLRIMSEYALFDHGSTLYQAEDGFSRLMDLRAHASQYLKGLSGQPIDDKFRGVYQVSKALDSFVDNRAQWQRQYQEVLSKKAEEKLFARNCIFELVEVFREGLCPVKLNGLWGAVDTRGRLAIDFKFEKLDMSCEGLMVAAYNGKRGYVSQQGNWVIPPQYEVAGFFSQGLAPVKKAGDDEITYIDSTGKAVFRVKASGGHSFKGGLAVFNTDRNRLGMINKEGKIVIKAKNKTLTPVHDGLLRLENNDFYDSTGKLVLSLPDYPDVGVFRNGRCPVAKARKIGFVDKSGKAVIPLQFDEVGEASFREAGLASVRIGSKWGFINQAGQMVIAPQFDNAMDFYDGLARVIVIDSAKQRAYARYIDIAGKVVCQAPPDIQQCWYFAEGFAPVKVNDKWGFMDKKGKILSLHVTKNNKR